MYIESARLITGVLGQEGMLGSIEFRGPAVAIPTIVKVNGWFFESIGKNT